MTEKATYNLIQGLARRDTFENLRYRWPFVVSNFDSTHIPHIEEIFGVITRQDITELKDFFIIGLSCNERWTPFRERIFSLTKRMHCITRWYFAKFTQIYI